MKKHAPCPQLSTFYAACLLLGLSLFSACSMLGPLLGRGQIQRPDIEFVGARLTGLSFDKANIQFDLKIKNPNPLGIKLVGFGYHLSIDDSPFLQGRENRELTIEARGENLISIPLTISYGHLYQVFESLHGEDQAHYRLKCDFSFDLPVLGVVQIPASKAGELLLPKLPAVSLERLKLEHLGLTGADLVLGIRLDNPNAFSMILEGMQYQFKIDGQSWASGETGSRIRITEKGQNLLEIPLSLDFIHIGQSIYQLLSQGGPLDYQIQGDLDLTTSLPLLDRTHLPFDRRGQVEVSR